MHAIPLSSLFLLGTLGITGCDQRVAALSASVRPPVEAERPFKFIQKKRNNPRVAKLDREVLNVLYGATSLTLHALSPQLRDGDPDAAGLFHGYPILATVEVTDRRQLVEVHTAMREALEEAPVGGKLCFMPRHALRVHHRAGALDLTICFQCQWIDISAPGLEERITLTDAGAPLLESLLTDTGFLRPMESLQ